MKRALFAIFGLLLALGWSQPVNAAANMHVFNNTENPVKVDIIYYTHLCRDDHFTLAPKTNWSINRGLCKTKSFSAIMTDKNGKQHQCFTGGIDITNIAVFRIKPWDRGTCAWQPS